MKVTYKFIVPILLLISLTFSYTYKIQSESECLTYDPTYKVCSKWSQSGTIEQDVSCFIGETIVKEQVKGYIQIKDLQEGEKILTLKDGQ